jgi:hypothetical protein
VHIRESLSIPVAVLWLAGLVGCQAVSKDIGPALGTATVSAGGNTLSARSVSVQAGKTASVPITINLGSGTNVAFFAMTFTVVPQGGAPAITDKLSYQSVIAQAPDLQAAVQAQAKLAIGYAGVTIAPALTGTVQIGTLKVPIPAGATGSYKVQLSKISAGDSSNHPITLTGQDGTITTGS